MSYYQPNPACRCGRCSTRGLMGPAVLITLGLLFLLANTPGYPFERTWPILLIVIGAIKVVRYVMPSDSHWNPGQYMPPHSGTNPQGGYPPPPYQPAAPQAEAQSGVRNGDSASGSGGMTPPAPIDDTADERSNEVHNG